MDWTDQIIPTPTGLGPIEITRAPDGGITAAGPDGTFYEIALNEQQPQLTRNCTPARATLGATVHLYRAPAVDRVRTVRFKQRGWGPWGRNEPVAPDLVDKTTQVMSIHFTELRNGAREPARRGAAGVRPKRAGTPRRRLLRHVLAGDLEADAALALGAQIQHQVRVQLEVALEREMHERLPRLADQRPVDVHPAHDVAGHENPHLDHVLTAAGGRLRRCRRSLRLGHLSSSTASYLARWAVARSSMGRSCPPARSSSQTDRR